MEVEGLGAKCNPNLSLVDVCGFNFHSGASEMTFVISLEKNDSIVCKKTRLLFISSKYHFGLALGIQKLAQIEVQISSNPNMITARF